ncbi:MAG: hypothetical protein IAF58_10000 [Leptolyngbya sp.]|nr:hypothetical protein [Candidatus Melainabacteria bacterium]
MDTGSLAITITFAIMVVIAILLMRQSEKPGSITQLEEVAAKLHSAFDEHKVALDALQLESNTRRELISTLPKQAAKHFTTLVAMLVAIEKIDDLDAFKTAIKLLKKEGVPIENKDDEKLVHTALLVFNAIIKTINEENGPAKFREKLIALKAKDQLQLIAADRPNVILDMAKEIQNDVGFSDLDQYLAIVEEELTEPSSSN